MFEEKIAELNRVIEEAPVLTRSCEEKRVYTVQEIMELLDISEPTAYKLIQSGAFRYVRVGAAYRISKVSFDEWLDKQC